jgi:hypothetical protein
VDGETDALAIVGTAVMVVATFAVGLWWIALPLLVLLVLLVMCVLPADW